MNAVVSKDAQQDLNLLDKEPDRGIPESGTMLASSNPVTTDGKGIEGFLFLSVFEKVLI